MLRTDYTFRSYHELRLLKHYVSLLKLLVMITVNSFQHVVYTIALFLYLNLQLMARNTLTIERQE